MRRMAHDYQRYVTNTSRRHISHGCTNVQNFLDVFLGFWHITYLKLPIFCWIRDIIMDSCANIQLTQYMRVPARILYSVSYRALYIWHGQCNHLIPNINIATHEADRSASLHPTHLERLHCIPIEFPYFLSFSANQEIVSIIDHKMLIHDGSFCASNCGNSGT